MASGRLSMKPSDEDLIAYARSQGAGLSVDNFVKNFFRVLVFEYSGMAIVAEIHTLKFKMTNEIKGLSKNCDAFFEKCVLTTQMSVLVEYSAASRAVLRFKCF